jgi:hypothetical protein
MIAMTLIVRNEADIIGANIAHHLALGVDRIIVTDNGSTDGTKDILAGLARTGQVDVTHEDGPFRQVERANEMVLEARAGGADWVTAFDADEFLMPPEGETLAAHLAGVAGRVAIVPRVNVFPVREEIETWDWRDGRGWRNAWPEGPPPRIDVLGRRMDWPYMAYATIPKVMFRPGGFVDMAKGGHHVTLDPAATGAETGMVLWHFPMRGAARLTEAIARRRPVLAADPGHPGVSGQYRRWIRLLDAGRGMEAVLDEILPSRARLEELVAAGAIAAVEHPIRAGRET